MDLEVVSVDRTWLDIPYREIPAKHMVRELPHWTLFEICIVELRCGVRGFGETMCFYTWGTVSDESIRQVIGKNAAEHMWDDSLGAGLQMALFDAVGRALDTPCWALLGHKHRDRAFLSFWDIDMTGEDWLSECQLAIDEGYTSFKTKARPWFDLYEQTRTLSDGLPPWFDIDLDFNGMLLDTARAVPVARRLGAFDTVAILETPIPQTDAVGTKRVREATHIPVALHYGVPAPQTALSRDICDGFVVGGGASAVTSAGATLAAHDKIFWLQLVGTDITATFSLHLASVLSHARWPAVNCHQLYAERLTEPSITVSGGSAPVPNGPGLGVDINRDLLAKYRIEPKERPYPAPDLLIAIRWPWGGSSYYTHARQYWDDFLGGRLPVFPEGVRLERVPNDGSREWANLRARAEKSPVHDSES
jgi:L-alanine-DL-glutamate epimerase-like enolase superfamily enzyme